MPGGDGTGPAGMGSMTGRGTGYCAGYPATGYPGFAFGRGFGAGRGGGRGRRNCFYATGLTGWQRSAYDYPHYGGTGPYGYQAYVGAVPYNAPYGGTATKQQELDVLKGQTEYLENSLEGIKKRIAELEGNKEE
ncbi:MAG: DUF5320 domain-containing protein [Deltaproteobacteria bacterium]|nr:DUF5320 domain-containing protein [Deltaproteobacteria bacterium]